MNNKTVTINAEHSPLAINSSLADSNIDKEKCQMTSRKNDLDF